MRTEKHTSVLKRHLALSGSRCLDIGCGTGRLVGVLRHYGAEAWGLEPGPQQLAKAQGDAALAGRLVAGVGEALPFAEESFDVALFFNSLHHVPEAAQAAALAEAVRVLRPGGRLYAMEPIAEGSLDAMAKPIDDESEIRAAARAELDAVEERLPMTLLHEEVYGAPYGYSDFEAWKAEMVGVDPRRAAAVAAHEAHARAVFEAEGETRDGKIWFVQPSRLHLFEKR